MYTTNVYHLEFLPLKVQCFIGLISAHNFYLLIQKQLHQYVNFLELGGVHKKSVLCYFIL